MEKKTSFEQVRNITISGRVASGATTLSKQLAEKLKWKFWNGGEIYRKYAEKNKIPLEHTLQSSDQYHLDLDNFIKKKLTTESHIIIESWLAGFDAQGITDVFKIFVTCSSDSLRIDRLVNREKMTIGDAKLHLRIREAENLEMWEKLYHTRDIWNPNLYDLIIDTYTNGPTETLDIALKAIGYHK